MFAVVSLSVCVSHCCIACFLCFLLLLTKQPRSRALILRLEPLPSCMHVVCRTFTHTVCGRHTWCYGLLLQCMPCRMTGGYVVICGGPGLGLGKGGLFPQLQLCTQTHGSSHGMQACMHATRLCCCPQRPVCWSSGVMGCWLG